MLAALALSGSLFAAVPPVTKEAAEPLSRTKRPDRQLQFYGFFMTRAEMTNVSPENDLFKGQVIGRLFGPNTTTTSRDRAVFVEQRFVPMFVLEPNLTKKRARLRASFELDWTFGDSSNGTGGNFGGGFTADQVNLQTQNVAVEIDVAKGWSIDLGLQRLYDSVYHPYRTPFPTLMNTGERLSFWGSDAVGATLYGTHKDWRVKAGAYLLHENLIQQDDDVSLAELAVDRHIVKTWHLGANVRYLRDTSEGAGGIGILGQGPDSQLADYMGAYRFTLPDDLEAWRGHFLWSGLNTSYNPNFTVGRVGGSAYAVGNFGQVGAAIPNQPGDFQKLTNVLGFAANVRAGVRYGRSPGDHIVAEGIVTSGDANGLEDGTYSGVMTGNTWGAPGAVYGSSGAYLLLPHANVVNRFYAAVLDISNAGYGLQAATLNIRYEFLRNKLWAKLGGAAGRSAVQPIEGGNFIGAEVNGNVGWRIAPLLNLEAHAAHLWLGDYYDSPEIVVGGVDGGRPRNPWTAFLTLKWLII